MVVRGCIQNQKIISIKWRDSNQTLPLTPASSLTPPDTIAINPVMTDPNVNATYLPVVSTSTNPGASGHPIHHEWVWFRLEG